LADTGTAQEAVITATATTFLKIGERKIPIQLFNNIGVLFEIGIPFQNLFCMLIFSDNFMRILQKISV
jgi:hypothetical protein